MSAAKRDRIAEILRLLRLHRGGLRAAVIEQRLAENGLPTSRRDVQRYLRELQEGTPPKVVQKDGTYGPIYMPTSAADTFDLAHMSTGTAITVVMLLRDAAGRLPPSVRDELESVRPAAEARLAQDRSNAMARWLARVRSVPRLHPLGPVRTNRAILAAIHCGLLNDLALEIDYRPRSGRSTRHTVSVLALIDQYPGLVLVVWKPGKPAPFVLNVDRITAVRLTDTAATRPSGFDLDTYIASGALHHPLEDGPARFEIRLRAKPHWVRVWQDAPLGESQRVGKIEGEWQEVQATVPNTFALRAYLRGCGAEIEVLAPDWLRSAFAAEAEAVFQHYGGRVSQRPTPKRSRMAIPA
jgi:predicted DNA-binding transcriptional regulator YafY